jgi:hypothetical protein
LRVLANNASAIIAIDSLTRTASSARRMHDSAGT